MTLLPARSQKVLQLRAGVDDVRPLSVRLIARRLHISRQRVLSEEIVALRRLRKAVQTSTCATATAGPPRLAFSSYNRPSGAGPLGSGGVAGALYLRAGTRAGAPRPPAGAAAPPGITGPNARNSVLVLLIVALAGALLVALLAAESIGVNPLRSLSKRRRR